MKLTPAQVRLLQQVKATGSTSSKVKCRESVIANGWIEQDRVEGYTILYKLTRNGECALARALPAKIVPDHVESGSKEHLDALCEFFGI